MKYRILTVVVAGFLAFGSGPAQAQTAEEVAADLDVACATDDLGAVVDSEGCLAVVGAALLLAQNGDAEFGVAIGFLLGELVERIPALAEAIVEAIEEAGVPAIAVGFSNAVGEDYNGPVPVVVSPA